MTHNKHCHAPVLRPLPIGLTLLLMAAVADAGSPGAALADCLAEPDDNKRLACYDALARAARDGSASPSTRSDASPDPGPATAARPAPLDDSVGKREDDQESQPQVYLSRLVQCSQSATSSRQLFHLENGQVWQQRNSGGSKVRNCDADVEIREVRLGFKLIIPSKGRSIRVVRLQ